MIFLFIYVFAVLNLLIVCFHYIVIDYISEDLFYRARVTSLQFLIPDQGYEGECTTGTVLKTLHRINVQ